MQWRNREYIPDRPSPAAALPCPIGLSGKIIYSRLISRWKGEKLFARDAAETKSKDKIVDTAEQ